MHCYMSILNDYCCDDDEWYVRMDNLLLSFLVYEGQTETDNTRSQQRVGPENQEATTSTADQT